MRIWINLQQSCSSVLYLSENICNHTVKYNMLISLEKQQGIEMGKSQRPSLCDFGVWPGVSDSSVCLDSLS